jgi:hypothetical protein
MQPDPLAIVTGGLAATSPRMLEARRRRAARNRRLAERLVGDARRQPELARRVARLLEAAAAPGATRELVDVRDAVAGELRRVVR